MQLRRPPALDLLIAFGLTAFGAIEIAISSAYDSPWPWVAGAGAAGLASLARRRAPLVTVAATCGAWVTLTELAPPPEDPLFWFLALLVASYSAGAHGGRWDGPAALVLLLAILGVGAALDGQGPGDLIFVGVIFGGAWTLGRALTRRTDEAAQLERTARRLERDREERAREAVAAERARIARELHDVVAHSVSVMTLQVGAVRRLLSVDQERERDALLFVEDTGRQALAEMRRLLGILRRADAERTLAPPPGLNRLDELAEQLREAGLEVELRREGRPVALAPGLDLSAFRIVQEALTNVVKHGGPARADVVVRFDPGLLRLEIDDDGRGVAAGAEANGGHGLVGMRERVALFGGELDAGARPGGGFRVHASLRIQGPPR